jgi:hypothetical protein
MRSNPIHRIGSSARRGLDASSQMHVEVFRVIVEALGLSFGAQSPQLAGR